MATLGSQHKAISEERAKERAPKAVAPKAVDFGLLLPAASTPRATLLRQWREAAPAPDSFTDPSTTASGTNNHSTGNVNADSKLEEAMVSELMTEFRTEVSSLKKVMKEQRTTIQHQGVALNSIMNNELSVAAATNSPWMNTDAPNDAQRRAYTRQLEPIESPDESHLQFWGIARGRHIGVFSKWEIVLESVRGFEGALFQEFSSETEAHRWVLANIARESQSPSPVPPQAPNPRVPGVVVDPPGERRLLEEWEIREN
jgi:hypothetical protein